MSELIPTLIVFQALTINLWGSQGPPTSPFPDALRGCPDLPEGQTCSPGPLRQPSTLESIPQGSSNVAIWVQRGVHRVQGVHTGCGDLEGLDLKSFQRGTQVFEISPVKCD